MNNTTKGNKMNTTKAMAQVLLTEVKRTYKNYIEINCGPNAYKPSGMPELYQGSFWSDDDKNWTYSFGGKIGPDERLEAKGYYAEPVNGFQLGIYNI